MTKYVVADIDEIAPGERKVVELEGRTVGVFNVEGEYFALLNHCPHAGAELCSFGTIFGASAAKAPDGQISYERGRSLRCPWHQWEFDIRTGESFYDPANARIRKYNVGVETLPGTPEDLTDPTGGVQPGPYVMEGYQAAVEGDVIVVDTSRRRRERRRRE